MRYKFLSTTIMMLLSMISWGQSQSHKLPQPQMTAFNSPSAPPPPGLPIDIGVPGLTAAGLALGIYFLRIRKIS